MPLKSRGDSEDSIGGYFATSLLSALLQPFFGWRIMWLLGFPTGSILIALSPLLPGLAEAKNGAVVRKHMGHWHIAGEHAQAIEKFYREFFNPYLNFHRPCAVAEVVEGAKGKRERIYRWYATPWQILRQLPGVAGYLRADATIAALDQRAREQTDTQAAQQMQQAKRRLFAGFEIPRQQTA